MGFCLFNNIAIAAEYLIQHENAERIFIVDIDLHHGNGTQDIFWNRSDVFFVSIHQYPLYPFSGQLEETGENEGAGYNANLPFPLQSGDNAREAALNEIILPLMESYRPDAVLMSVGFDAHWRDPLGHQLATTSGYVNFIQTISRWTDKFCEGKMGLFLEGGYDIEAGAASALAVCQALAGDDWEDQLGSGEIEESNKWEKVITQAKHVWKLN